MPGIMYVRGDEVSVKEWVKVVHVGLSDILVFVSLFVTFYLLKIE